MATLQEQYAAPEAIRQSNATIASSLAPATNAMANQPAAGGFVAPYSVDPIMTKTALTLRLAEAQRAAESNISSQAEQDALAAREQGEASTNFQRAMLGKIGGFESSYGSSSLDSIAYRTQKNVQSIRSAAKAAIEQSRFDLANKLAEVELQNLQTLTDLNRQAFDRYTAERNATVEDQKLAIVRAQEDRAAREANMDVAESSMENNATGDVTIIYRRPDGSRYTKVYKGVGNRAIRTGGGSGNFDQFSGLPKGFMDAADNGMALLQKGLPWGDVWNRMKLQYPNVSNDKIDQALGGRADLTNSANSTGFAREGAYQTYRSQQLAGNYNTNVTSTDINANINREASKPAWKNLNEQQRINFVLANGGSPSDFYDIIYQ